MANSPAQMGHRAMRFFMCWAFGFNNSIYILNSLSFQERYLIIFGVVGWSVRTGGGRGFWVQSVFLVAHAARVCELRRPVAPVAVVAPVVVDGRLAGKGLGVHAGWDMDRRLSHLWVVRRVQEVLLFVVAVGVRALCAVQEPVVNPDAIRFIDQARGLRTDFLGALRSEVYHPLHSVAALLVHAVIGSFFRNDREAWVAAVQTVGVVCGAIVAVQIVWLARAFGAPRLGVACGRGGVDCGAADVGVWGGWVVGYVVSLSVCGGDVGGDSGDAVWEVWGGVFCGGTCGMLLPRTAREKHGTRRFGRAPGGLGGHMWHASPANCAGEAWHPGRAQLVAGIFCVGGFGGVCVFGSA